MSSTTETRESLLQAAWELMREDASSATLARIAQRAGVSRQALYLHFDDRAGLLLAMVRWVDERERFGDKLKPICKQSNPARRLEGYVRLWLDYLPLLHPVPGFLSRAKTDPAARAAWEDRMKLVEGLYADALRGAEDCEALRPGLSVTDAVTLVRALASVDAWEHLAVDHQWEQKKAVDALWSAVSGAVLNTRTAGSMARGEPAE